MISFISADPVSPLTPKFGMGTISLIHSDTVNNLYHMAQSEYIDVQSQALRVLALYISSIDPSYMSCIVDLCKGIVSKYSKDK